MFSLGFPDHSVSKESSCSVGDLGLIPGLGGFLGEGKGYPLQYSGLENSMDCTVHGLQRVRPLSNFHMFVQLVKTHGFVQKYTYNLCIFLSVLQQDQISQS